MDSGVQGWLDPVFQPGGPKPYPNIQPGCLEDLIFRLHIIKAHNFFLSFLFFPFLYFLFLLLIFTFFSFLFLSFPSFPLQS
jgi:hypothetical protein